MSEPCPKLTYQSLSGRLPFKIHAHKELLNLKDVDDFIAVGHLKRLKYKYERLNVCHLFLAEYRDKVVMLGRT